MICFSVAIYEDGYNLHTLAVKSLGEFFCILQSWDLHYGVFIVLQFESMNAHFLRE